MDKIILEDWQLGNESVTTPLSRVEYMNDWLKKNKAEILTKKEVVEEPQIFLGFDDLKMY
jgi:hypothetical protein